MSDRINTLLETVASDLKGRVQGVRECAPHEGRFSLKELKRIAAQAPALYVACLGVPETEDPGTEQTEAQVDLALYVVTRTRPGTERGALARELVEWLLVYLPRARWGLTGVGPAEKLKAENLYSGEIDDNGLALWVITWRQGLVLGESVWDEDGEPITDVYVGWNPESWPEDYTEITDDA